MPKVNQAQPDKFQNEFPAVVGHAKSHFLIFRPCTLMLAPNWQGHNMADMLELTCYEILYLLHECTEPPLPGGDLYLDYESAVCGLSAFVDALRARSYFTIACLDDRLRQRLLDLANLILLTEVGELSTTDSAVMRDLNSLCSGLQSDPVYPDALATIKRVYFVVGGNSSVQDTPSITATDDAENREGTSTGTHHKRAYAQIGHLLETYIYHRNGTRKQRTSDIWEHILSVVSQFSVHNIERRGVLLRRRMEDVAEAVRLGTVVEETTPLSHFLQPQVENIFAALKGDMLDVRILLADRMRLARYRLRRWLEHILRRLARCIRCSVAA